MLDQKLDTLSNNVRVNKKDYQGRIYNATNEKAFFKFERAVMDSEQEVQDAYLPILKQHEVAMKYR